MKQNQWLSKEQKLQGGKKSTDSKQLFKTFLVTHIMPCKAKKWVDIVFTVHFFNYETFIKHQLMHINFIHKSLFLKFTYMYLGGLNHHLQGVLEII
jgi:hypothetical protein